MQKTLPARTFRLALRPLHAGSYVQLDELTGRWAQTGYEPVNVVEEPGTFARRGGIVDIWPPNLPHPVRVDLFGDEVESIREFDPATQRSDRQLQRVLIGPGSEALGLAQKRRPDAERLRETLLADPELVLVIREEIGREIGELEEGHVFRGIEWYLPYAYTQPASLLDHLPSNSLLVIDDGAELRAGLQACTENADSTRHELLRGRELPGEFQSCVFSQETILDQVAQCNPLQLGTHSIHTLGSSEETSSSSLARSFTPSPHFAGQSKRILDEMRKYAGASDRVVLVSRQSARLQEELSEARAGGRTAP